MEIAAATALASGAQTVWKYNRENFMYDREMRFKKELKVMDFRALKSALWRDDLREVIGLTESRMDSYIIVSALQLDICVGLMCEGRMEPGTPPWLLNFYMLTLGGAFTYLFMSIWFATHASVVAQCCSIRLLTQFVRLPVPTWPHFEAARTYATNYEESRLSHMLRVPFVGKKKPADQVVQGADSASSQDAPAPQVEEHRNDIYELMRAPTSLGHHIGLARQASRYYQCFDAFARVSMLFGTNQLLSALAYFSVGYCSVQDRSLTGSWCVVAIAMGIAVVITEVDLSLTRLDRTIVQVLTIAGPVCVSIATYAWMLYSADKPIFVRLAYATHCGWLLFTLRKTQVTQQRNGAMLPMKFRPSIFVDVFGWWAERRPTSDPSPDAVEPNEGGYEALPATDDVDEDQPSLARARSDVTALQADHVFEAMEPHDRARVERLAEQFAAMEEGSSRGLAVAKPDAAGSASPRSASSRKAKKVVRLQAHTDYGAEMGYFVNERSGSISYEDAVPCERRVQRTISAAERHLDALSERRGAQAKAAALTTIPRRGAPESSSGGGGSLAAWLGEDVEPFGWKKIGKGAADSDEEDYEEHPLPDETLHDFSATFPHAMRHDAVLNTLGQFHPGLVPWRMFCLATMMLASLWTCSLLLPMHVLAGFRSQLAPELEDADDLGEGEVLEVGWPKHLGFIPRAISCDTSGERFIVADEFGVYAARLVWGNSTRGLDRSAAISGQTEEPPPEFPELEKLGDAAVAELVALRGTAASGAGAPLKFDRVPICKALEGQSYKDVDVVCPKEGRAPCRVFVLHGHNNLTECPIYMLGTGLGSGNLESSTSWTISEDWLQDEGEKIGSVAIRGDCIHGAEFLAEAFTPESSGCLVVGTSQGRIVQLRPHLTEPGHLVPDRAIRRRTGEAEANNRSNALHIFGDRFFVALRSKIGALQALAVDNGALVGEWRLPQGVEWLTLSGGGDSLFLVGRQGDHGTVKLWRFKVPDKLRSAASEHGGFVESVS
mmetsp:Transcript_66827/g.186565  ORF Transcript_66827/g.186565 Transcript_66827/m.186565 type:complete len:1006 (+) Transcript_66827:92-3109(+)